MKFFAILVVNIIEHILSFLNLAAVQYNLKNLIVSF